MSHGHAFPIRGPGNPLFPLIPPQCPDPMASPLSAAVIYQIVLRNFTRDGNFCAAAEMLGHVRSVGVDAVYLSPFVEMDRDMDESGWSPRQLASGYHTPKNPYRISDYDRIDPEYGTDADFAAFNDRAHALGMGVFMDLVYLHCGPNNVMRDRIPDAFQRNADGTVRTTQWRFPFVNFESRAVRRYLIDSMLHWIRLGCDGFRCDVGDAVPLEFWREAVAECRKVRPGLTMILEGTNPAYLEDVFDASYAWPWSFTVRNALCGTTPHHGYVQGATFQEKMAHVRECEAKMPPDALGMCFLDNHDTAADDWGDRFDRIHPVEAGNAAFVLTFLRRGVPLLFNGNEIADNSLSTFFAPVEDVGRARKTVDWARALQPAGQNRLELIRDLARLRHDEKAFSDGTQEWVTAGEAQGAVAFVRRLGDRAVFVAANLAPTHAEFDAGISPLPGAKPLLACAGDLLLDGLCRLGPYGYIAADISGTDGIVR